MLTVSADRDEDDRGDGRADLRDQVEQAGDHGQHDRERQPEDATPRRPRRWPRRSRSRRCRCSDDETALIESSTTGRQRALDRRRREPEQPVGDRRALHQQEQREERQRHEREDRAEHAARDAEQRARGVRQPGGEVLERLADLSSAFAVDDELWNAGLLRDLVPVRRAARGRTRRSGPRPGPAVTSTSAKTAANSAAKTASAARPRPQPRATSAPTTGSRPSAITAARKIDSSVPSDTIASATSAPNASEHEQRPHRDDDLDALQGGSMPLCPEKPFAGSEVDDRRRPAGLDEHPSGHPDHSRSPAYAEATALASASRSASSPSSESDVWMTSPGTFTSARTFSALT